MNDFINYVIFFSGTFVGGILTYLIKTQIEHRLAIVRNYDILKSTEFNKAAASFRMAFIDAIYALRSNIRSGEIHPGNILNESVVVAHEKAKIMFEPFIPTSDLESFNAAWQQYRYGERNKEAQNNAIFRKELSQTYLNHIDNLLKYAESKSIT